MSVRPAGIRLPPAMFIPPPCASYLLAREEGGLSLLHESLLLGLELVGDLADLLGLGVVALPRHDMLPPPPLQQLARPLGRLVRDLLWDDKRWNPGGISGQNGLP